MPVTASDLGALAAELITELGIPGAQIAVLADGDVLEAAAGTTSLETQVPVTVDTAFQIGSTTKVHTAALVMQLVEEGAIGLDTPVVEQLPGFALADAVATRSVTPRHLLSMSSGIDNGPYADHGRGDDAVGRYVAALADVPIGFRPGTGFGYSNASTNVSGRLVEHVTGKTWEQVLRERLLEPAHLSTAATSAEELIWRRFAVGHELRNSGVSVLPTWSLPRSMAPAGSSLCCSAGDLVRFSHLFVADGCATDGTQVLTPETVKAMHGREVRVPPTLVADWWGLGPYGKVWDGLEVCGHTGTNVGGSSTLLWARERGVAIATTVNLSAQGYPFAQRVLDELLPRLAGIDIPRRPEPPGEVSYDADRLIGSYAMQAGELTVSRASSGGLQVAARMTMLSEIDAPPSPLVPLTPTTFLPTDPRIDGRRGWALAFLGPEDAPATHLLNGVFLMRRVG